MNFESLGMIETKGLLPSIEAADAMLKAADVYLFKKEHAGAGLTMIMVLGNVAAVKASLGAGYTAAERVQEKSVKNICVIPRPDEQVMKVFSRNLRSKIPYPNDGKNLEDPDTWVLENGKKPEGDSSEKPTEEITEELDLEFEKEIDLEEINLLDIEVLIDFSKTNEVETTTERLKQYRVKDLKDLYFEMSDVASADLNKMNKSEVIEGIENELYSE